MNVPKDFCLQASRETSATQVRCVCDFWNFRNCLKWGKFGETINCKKISFMYYRDDASSTHINSNINLTVTFYFLHVLGLES